MNFSRDERKSISMLFNLNEYHENARMMCEYEDEPRRLFLDAVRAFAKAEDNRQQVKLIEAIIRTSRSVADDTGVMHADIRDTLYELAKRYQALGLPAPTELTTYQDARQLLQRLFF